MLLAALFGVSQGVWANGSAGGPAAVRLYKNSSNTWYNVYSTSWDYTPTCTNYTTIKSATSFSGDLGTVTTLYISGYAKIGWAEGSDWVAAQLGYKIDSGSYSYIKIGNYDSAGSGSADVACTSGNDRVCGYVGWGSSKYNILSGLSVGSHTLYLKPYGKMQWNNNGSSGTYNGVEHSEVSATFTVPGWATTSGSKAFGSVNVGSNSSATISLGTHYGATSTATSSVTGTNASDFSVTSVSATSVTVIFTPSAAGSRTATVTITDAYSKTYTLSVSGTGVTSCSTPSANDIAISSPSSATTLYLGTGSAPSVDQTVTATCSKGNTYLWSATPTTYTSSSCWSSTATRVAFTSASSKSATATFYHEGVYTATFAAGCGNTTDASKNAPIITVKPGHIYFDGPFFSGSNYDLTKHHLEIDKSNDEFVYEWTATSSNTVATNDFIISVGNQCINATTSAYDIGNYADLTLNGLVIPDKDTSGNTNCNHNFRANIGTIAVGERLKLTISYTGVNSSGVPKYTVKLEKVCSNPTVQTVSGTATICDGSSTNVTVSSSQSNYTYKLYKGGSATSTTQAGTGSALNFSVSEAGAYTVHAYYTSGSDAYCKADMTGSATVTVTPTASIGSVTLSSSSGCIGQGLSATANSVELGGGTGAWSSSNTSIATVSSTGNITPKAAGSANITYTITDGCGGTKSAQTSLTVNPNNSVAGVTISLDKNNVCAGVSVQASKSGTPVVSPGATAQWYSSTAKATIDPSTGAITTNSGGTSNISYRVTGGCGSTVETSAQTLTIKSIPTLTPASSSVENFTPVRIGANEDVTWSVAEQAYDSYLFEQTARKTKFKGTVGAGANKTFTVNGTGANGCAGSATVTVTKDNESCN